MSWFTRAQKTENFQLNTHTTLVEITVLITVALDCCLALLEFEKISLARMSPVLKNHVCPICFHGINTVFENMLQTV